MFIWRYTNISTAVETQINEKIQVKEARIVGPAGEQLGLMPIDKAREYAFSQGYDLVLVAPNATPPVCKVMDYGKYKFEKEKREKEAKKNQQVSKIKEIQLSCRIDKHDFDTRVNHALKFLAGGDKVKAVIRFKGRELSHTEIGIEVINRFVEACSEVGFVEKPMVTEGRFVSVVIVPIKK